MTTGLSILIIEDNTDLAQTIGEHLEGLGHVVDFAGDGPAGLGAALANAYDVIILDIALPRMDGLTLCRELRARSPRHTPVLMLTARDTLPDKLAGFGAGADDYLTKPFDLAELGVRCLALSRRHLAGTGHELALGELRLDRQRQTVTRAGQPIALHPVGWRILLTLAEAHPRIVARSELIARVWGDEPPDSDALRTHLYLLRRALDRPFAQPMLRTVHSVGYRLEVGA